MVKLISQRGGEHVTAADRREEILDYLAANRSATAPELAVRFQVSAKTIRRDLEWLSHGYPLEIIPGNGGGVRVMDRRYIYGGKFTPEEYETSVFASAGRGQADHDSILTPVLNLRKKRGHDTWLQGTG